MGPGSALSLGVSTIWLSLLVLIPLAAVLVSAAELGPGGFWDVVTQQQTRAALVLTVGESALVTALNVVMGTVLAWVLVRDRFWGKSLLSLVIDVPFALPTIVAGLVLLTLYGPKSPLGLNAANTRFAVFLALAFVTLPFVVRTVQPVLESLELDVEEAAASLGASRLTTFRRVILPSLVPAIAAVPRCPSPGRSASTARWCCSRATCPTAPRSPPCASTASSRTATRAPPRPSPRSCSSSRSS